MAPNRDRPEPDIRLVHLGAAIRLARRKSRLTQKEAGERLKLSQAGYRRWEAGEVSAPVAKLMDAAELFGTTLGRLTSSGDLASLIGGVAEPDTFFIDREDEELLRSYKSAPDEARQAVRSALGL